MIETIKWTNRGLRIIDQTRLPLVEKYIYTKDIKSLWWAIKKLQVRGAPAIGVAAGFGAYIGVKNLKFKSYREFKNKVGEICSYLASSRPTAVNLRWALTRIEGVVRNNSKKSITQLKSLLLKEAQNILKEDVAMCEAMGSYGATLIKNGDCALTVCNAGALATAGIGTALSVFHKAKRLKKKFKVYSCETRPLLQGARLTTWELKQGGVDVVLICDNMAATLMQQGKIKKVFTGADRIAANGDSANKIGTYNLALLARYHKIPFYVVAPYSTFDLRLENGSLIPIEERSADEVRKLFLKKQIAPPSIKVYNPAFDVTPNKLISAIITEKGIIRPLYRKNIIKKLGRI